MIETEQAVSIDAPIGSVWDYVKDIERWANLMPGLQECAVIDANDSRWTLKVGVGGLVRTVNVLVHVDEWDGPGRVTFSYKLAGDPVKGGGSYWAVPNGSGATDVTLQIRVEGTGPMAPMWEAMGRPLLPQFAKGFAGQLKGEIEKAVGAPVQTGTVEARKKSALATIAEKLRMAWHAMVGSRAGREEKVP